MKFRDDFPLPDTDWEATRPFWAAAARGVLAVTRCDLCGRWAWYPEGHCRHCGGTRLTWTEVSGRGRLFAWSIVHRAFIPQLADQVPYVTGLVSIDEDPAVRIVTRIVDCPHDELRADMRVRVSFRPLRFTGIAREVQAPMFVPA
jgi:uncharacterized OB-fold protein